MNIRNRLPRFSDEKQRRAAGNIVKFLAGLLVLTLIARGTSGAALPRVDITNPTRGEIVEAVTGSASVSSKEKLEVNAPEGLTIIEVYVGAGQSVEYGEALLLLDMDEAKEKLDRESINLDKLLLDLEKLQKSDSIDSTSIESAQRTLDRAIEDYESQKAQGELDIETARTALREALGNYADSPDVTSLENAKRSLERVIDDYEAVQAQGESDVAEAVKARDELLAGSADIIDKSALENAKRTYDRAVDDYNALEIQSENEIRQAEYALTDAQAEEEARASELWYAHGDEEKAEAEKRYEEAAAKSKQAADVYNSAYDKAQENLSNSQRKVEDALVSYNKAQQDYEKNVTQTQESRQAEIEKAEAAIGTAQAKARENLLSAQRKVEDAEASLEKAQADYNKSLEQLSETQKSNIEKAQSDLESAQSKAKDNLLGAERKIQDAEASLAKAIGDYGKTAEQNSETAEQNSITAATTKLDIENKRELVNELRGLVENDGKIFADMEGIVSSVATEGSVTTTAAVVTFRDGAKGFEAVMEISKTDADKLAVGDECRVTTGGGGMYYNPTETSVIRTISQPDDNDRVSVTIDLPGLDWTEGQKIDVNAVQSNDTYNQCIPLSALRSDNTGYFIYTVEQKSSVLGIENTVTRVEVTVSALDDSMAAIQGSIGQNADIISGSSRSLEAGDRVRINQ